MSIEGLAGINPATVPQSTGVSNVDKEAGQNPVLAPQQIKQPENVMVLHNEKKRLKETVELANNAIKDTGRHFKYEIHKPTKQVVISVVDNATDEVITEIPAKKLLDVVGKLMELAGLFVDERR